MKKFFALLTCIALTATIFASSVTAMAFERQTEEGTLTLGISREADSMQPGHTSAATAMSFVYETLFTFYNDEIVGLLAEDWEWTDDTTLKIKLHDGITFSNGEPLTSEDVIYSLNRIITSESRMSSYYNMIDFDNCEIIDDLNFTIKYEYPYGPALTILCDRSASIICKSYAENCSDEDWWDKPIGTGPYMMTENVSGSHASYVANPNYWGGIPNQPCVDSLTLRFYADTTTMFIDYETGVLDAAFGVSANDIARVTEGEVEGTNYIISSAWDSLSIVYPSYVEELQDIRVRQAIAYAIDKDAVAKAAYGALADTNMDSILPPNTPYRDMEFNAIGYDVDKAKELMEEAGYADGFTLDAIMINSPQNNTAAEAIKAYLAEIGITLNATGYDRSTAMTMIYGGETQLDIHSLGEAYDPYQVLYGFLSLENGSTSKAYSISDEQFNEYILNGTYSVDPEVRAENYKQALEFMMDNCFMTPICYINCACVYRDYVTDLYAATYNGPILRYFNVK